MKDIDNDYVVFSNLIRDQFSYGGKKYAKTKTKEATDILFERHTYRWLVGTIDKYCFRFANLERERDLLKIATYMYITWLKRGYHINPNKGVAKVINTTVETKDAHYKMFSHRCRLHADYEIKNSINFISRMMSRWSKKSFIEIKEKEIQQVFLACFFEWLRKYSKVNDNNRDLDTWNELKKQLKKKSTLIKSIK